MFQGVVIVMKKNITGGGGRGEGETLRKFAIYFLVNLPPDSSPDS